MIPRLRSGRIGPRGRLVAAVAAAAAAVVLLVQVAGGGGRPLPDRAAAFVPRDALLYLHLSTDPEREQAERGAALAGKLPSLRTLRDAVVSRASAPVGGLDLDREVRGWLGDEAAVAVIGTPEGPESLLVFDAEDERAATDFARRAARSSRGARHRGVEVLASGGRAAAVQEGFVLAGAPAAVRAGIDARTEASPSLAGDRTYRALRARLPAERLIGAYASQAGLRALLSGPAAPLAGLPGAGDMRAGALSLSIEEEVARLTFLGVSAGDRPCAPAGEPEAPAPDRGPAASIAYVRVTDAACAIRSLMASPSSSVGAALRRLAAGLRQTRGLDLHRDLVPLLGADSTLQVGRRGRSAPVATLINRDVPRDRALAVLRRLEPVVLDLVDAEEVGAVPSFRAQDAAGVTALTADLAPGISLSYAAFDGKLALSTALEGIVAARREAGLERTEDFRLMLGDRPEGAAAVVFLDLDKLVALADRIGLAEEPAYALLRGDLRRTGAAGAIVSREGQFTTIELRLKTP